MPFSYMYLKVDWKITICKRFLNSYIIQLPFWTFLLKFSWLNGTGSSMKCSCQHELNKNNQKSSTELSAQISEMGWFLHHTLIALLWYPMVHVSFKNINCVSLFCENVSGIRKKLLLWALNNMFRAKYFTWRQPM